MTYLNHYKKSLFLSSCRLSALVEVTSPFTWYSWLCTLSTTIPFSCKEQFSRHAHINKACCQLASSLLQLSFIYSITSLSLHYIHLYAFWQVSKRAIVVHKLYHWSLKLPMPVFIASLLMFIVVFVHSTLIPEGSFVVYMTYTFSCLHTDIWLSSYSLIKEDISQDYRLLRTSYTRTFLFVIQKTRASFQWQRIIGSCTVMSSAQPKYVKQKWLWQGVDLLACWYTMVISEFTCRCI